MADDTPQPMLLDNWDHYDPQPPVLKSRFAFPEVDRFLKWCERRDRRTRDGLRLRQSGN